MYYNKVEICGVNTSKLKKLTAEETQDLLIKTHKGDADARQQLIDGNLRLVLSIIQRFTNRGENMDDLFQVGCIGLIKAVDNFNITLEVRFSTYAVPMNILSGNSILSWFKFIINISLNIVITRKNMFHKLQRCFVFAVRHIKFVIFYANSKHNA